METIIIGLILIGAVCMIVNYSVDRLKGSGSCHDCSGCCAGCAAGDSGGKEDSYSAI